MIKHTGVYSIAAGDLIIAPPTVDSGLWAKTVILLGQHDEDGSQGWVLNRTTNHYVSEILEGMNVDLMGRDWPLYWGGPVSPQTIWMLHSPEWHLDNTRRIDDNWSITSNQAMFHHLADGDMPKYFKIFMGYTGWGADQLKQELTAEPPRKHSQSWLTLRDLDSQWVLDLDGEDLWRSAIGQSIQQSVDSLF